MDPLTHTFAGAALAAAGLRRVTPLATAALVIGANIPDVDGLAYFAGEFEAFAFRRGWTHGVLALPLWPFVLTALLLSWDRWVRRRRDPSAARARAGPLLALTALAVLTHPTLDWLNNYGMRWLMPFDGRWFYGDALFIIDPWVWLLLGGALFLMHSNGGRALAAWAAFWAFASFAVLGNPALVPLPARIVWVAALGSIVAARWLARSAVRRERTLERAAAAALGLVAVYVAATVAASSAARAQVRAALAASGLAGVEQVMVGPSPANPFGGDVVAATADRYYFGRWNWLEQPRFELAPESVERPRGAAFEAAALTPDARDFLTWSRFPVADVERAEPNGFLVRFSDARYRNSNIGNDNPGASTAPTVSGDPGQSGRLDGPIVRLDEDLRVHPPAAQR
jgi:inner membrane protein